jgi:hypothetical protein
MSDEEQGIELANEFARVRVSKLETDNGVRLLIESPLTGHSIALCPLQLESLTWQRPDTFSRFLSRPFEPLDG